MVVTVAGLGAVCELVNAANTGNAEVNRFLTAIVTINIGVFAAAVRDRAVIPGAGVAVITVNFPVGASA